MKFLKASLIICLALAMILSFSGCVTIHISSESYPDSDKYTAGDAVYDAEEIKTISIDYAAGDINMVLSGTSSVKVTERTKTDIEEQYRIHTYLDENGTLFIKYCKSDVKINSDSISSFFKNYEKKLTVELPEALALESLELDAAAGNIEIELGTCKDVNIDTAAGDIKIYGADITNFDLDSAAGNITAGFGKAPAKADFDNAAGNITIAVPKDSGITLDYDKGAGDFKCDMQYTKDGSTYVIGDGSSEFDVDMAAGDLTILGK